MSASGVSPAAETPARTASSSAAVQLSTQLLRQLLLLIQRTTTVEQTKVVSIEEIKARTKTPRAPSHGKRVKLRINNVHLEQRLLLPLQARLKQAGVTATP